MRALKRWSAVLLIAMMSVLGGGRAAWAAVCPGPSGSTIACGPLQYHGGPFLETFEIYPLYYGLWTQGEIDAQQVYLTNLAAYMSGTNAPALKQPMMRQYGVRLVTVAAPAKASPDASAGALSRDSIVRIIETNQSRGNLQGWGPNNLIVLFPGKGFSLEGCNGCGYHSSQSISAFWAVIPRNAGQLVIAHEIFEASTDPADDTYNGWDEAVDQCDNAPPITLSSFGGMQIPPATDNTNGGACSASGYTSLDEVQDYEVTHDQFLNDYNTYSSQHYRLYILQAFVLANGDVRYNAVWRTGTHKEQVSIAATSTQFQSDYTTFSSQGWRLYILQSFVVSSGEVRYNAVWRRGDYYDGNGQVIGYTQEQPDFGVTPMQFASDFNTIYNQPSNEKGLGWRLSILQTYVSASGSLRYNSVWRPGDVQEADHQQATDAQFNSDYAALFPRGWRLYSFQSYVVPGGQVLHNIVWRPATYDEIAIYGQTYTDYRAKYDAIFRDGWRLYILNTYVLPGGGVRYDAVWRLGTYDRPL